MDEEQEELSPVLFVGIDWATDDNQVCVLDAAGEVVEERSFRNDGSGLSALCIWLLSLVSATASRIWVAIEVPHGPVVETLLERGFVVHSINPKQLDRFRDRFTVAGAKDDRRDARVLAASLRTDAHVFRRLRVTDPLVIELREWSRMDEELKVERVRLTHRIRDLIRRYYPQLLLVSDDPGLPWMLELWRIAPTPEHARRLTKSRLTRLLRKHRVRRLDAAQVRELLTQESVRVAPGTVPAVTSHIAQLGARVKLVNEQIQSARRALDRLLESLASSEPSDEETAPGQRREQHDVEILRSLPGVGRIVLAVLLTEASQPVADRDYHALRVLCGIAPVTQQSGRSKLVVMRRACHPRLRDAVYHWARVASMRDPTASRCYAELRARGHSHGRALRSVADRLLRIACALLRHGTRFDPNRQSSRGLAA